jgi:hypothetical protein
VHRTPPSSATSTECRCCMKFEASEKYKAALNFSEEIWSFGVKLLSSKVGFRISLNLKSYNNVKSEAVYLFEFFKKFC